MEVILEVRQEIEAKLLILNGGQRRDRTADAGLFRAALCERPQDLFRRQSGKISIVNTGAFFYEQVCEVNVSNFCCTLLAKLNNLSHRLGANLIPVVAPTCVKTVQIQSQRSRALLFVTPDIVL